jgi:7-cyano-7-deazaguanine synthase
VSDLVLFSGGVDSTCVAALVPGALCLTIDYGHASAEGEIRASQAVASSIGLRHEVLRVDCSPVGSGLLAGNAAAPGAPSEEWWPFRNQLLVTLAAGAAFQNGCDRVIVGSVRSDGFHRDGTAEFYSRLDAVVREQEGGVRVEAPAIELTTIELVGKAGIGAPVLGWTFSCHRASIACGDCPGCNKRRGVLRELGLV